MLLAGNIQNITGPLDDGQLETKTDPEEGNVLLSGVLDSHQHTFRSTFAETAGDKDTSS